jgi:hypothetical protein
LSLQGFDIWQLAYIFVETNIYSNMKKLLFAAILFLAASASPCYAQLKTLGGSSSSSSSNGDSRIKRQLDALGLKYEVTETGKFKVIFDMGGDRTQLVIIYSKTYEYGGIEIREIYSTAASATDKTEYTQTTLLTLLEKNQSYKVGSWQIDGGTSPFILQFGLRISATVSQDVLKEMLLLAARAADEMEQKLTEGDKH